MTGRPYDPAGNWQVLASHYCADAARALAQRNMPPRVTPAVRPTSWPGHDNSGRSQASPQTVSAGLRSAGENLGPGRYLPPRDQPYSPSYDAAAHPELAALDYSLGEHPEIVHHRAPRRPVSHDYTVWAREMARDAFAEEPADLIREILGPEHFAAPDPEPEPDTRMYLIGSLSKRLGRSPGKIREWMRDGILPEPPRRTSGGRQAKRLWTADELSAIVTIAEQEGLLDNKYRSNIRATNFSARVRLAMKKLADAG